MQPTPPSPIDATPANRIDATPANPIDATPTSPADAPPPGSGGSRAGRFPSAIVDGLECLAALAGARHQDTATLVSAVLDLLADCLDAGATLLGRVEGPTLHVDRVCNRAGLLLEQSAPVAAYCATMLAQGLPALLVEDVRADRPDAVPAGPHDPSIGAFSGVPLYHADGRPYGALCALHSHARPALPGEAVLLTLAGRLIMQALELEQEHAGAQRFRALAERAPDLLSIVDADGTMRYVSPSYQSLLGYSAADLLGRSVCHLVHPDDLPLVRRAWAEQLQQEGTASAATAEAALIDPAADAALIDPAAETALIVPAAEAASTPPAVTFRMQHADGSWRTFEVLATNGLADPAVQGIIVHGRDVTARTPQEKALQVQAPRDVTALSHRALLQDRLQQAILSGQRAGTPFALLLLTLDGVTGVDTHDVPGHPQRPDDLLIHQVGRRVQSVLRATDTVARLDGDNYAVLLPTADAAGAFLAAQKILAALDALEAGRGAAVHIGARLGIVLYPDHGREAADLLRQAAVARDMAKHSGRRYALYDARHDAHSPSYRALLRELRQSIAQEGLVLHYQALVDLTSGHLRGMEALLRWPHPHRGQVPPDRFIPLAEQTGLIGPLTQWVLQTALRQCRAWQQAGLPLGVAVNLSMHTLHDPRFPDLVAGLLRRHEVAPSYLTLEITESVLMTDPERAVAVLSRLAELGVRLAIDDFGTGYASLSYLRQLPVDELKIDKSFVLGGSATDAAIVRSIIALGHSLGLTVVAEGVESGTVWDLVAALGCDTAQGFYLSHPLPAADVETWVREAWSDPPAQ